MKRIATGIYEHTGKNETSLYISIRIDGKPRKIKVDTQDVDEAKKMLKAAKIQEQSKKEVAVVLPTGAVRYGKHYSLTMDGKIYSHRSNKFLSQVGTSNGYVRAQVGKKLMSTHIIIAEAFIPNPNCLPEVNHINGIKNDNRVVNLEWVSRKENAIHGGAMTQKRNMTERLAPTRAAFFSGNK